MSDSLSAPGGVAAPEPQPRKASNFGVDMLKLVSGSTAAQLITLLATPILTRLFTPEAYGIGVAFSAVISVIAVFVCLRYEQAIVLPEDEAQAINLVGVSAAATLLITAISALVFGLWGGAIFGWLNLPELEPYGWAAPVTLAFTGALLILNAWNTRTRAFGRISVNTMLNSLFTTGSRLAAGAAGWATGGAMILTNLFGTVVAVVELGALTLRADGALWFRTFGVREMRQIARRYKELPLFNTWSALLNTISWQLPVFMLAAFFSPAVAGQYALGNRLIKTPMSIIGNAIGQAFYPRAAEAAAQSTLAPLVESTFRRLVTFGLAPMLYLAIEGEALFAFFFGAQWAEAGVYMQVLAVWSFFWFISSPISTLYLVLERQRWFLIWNTINFATRFLSLWIGGVYGNPLLALSLFGLSGIVMYGYLNLYLMAQAGVALSTALRILGVHALAFLPVLALILVLRWVQAPVWVQLLLPALLVAASIAYGLKDEEGLRTALARRLHARS